MSERIWVLGAPDPVIDQLLRECGEHVVYATGRPVHVGDATDIYLVGCSPPLACGAGWDDPGSYYEPVRIGARYYPRADADYTRRIVDICPYLPGTPEESLLASIVGRVIAELARTGVALPWDSEYVPGLAVGQYFRTDAGRYLIGTADGALYVPPQYVHAAANHSIVAADPGELPPTPAPDTEGGGVVTMDAWHHGYRAPCILRAVAHAIREGAEHHRHSSLEWLRDYSAWLRGTARELDQRAKNLSDDAYGLVSDLAGALLSTLRLLRGAPAACSTRADYLLCGLSEKDPGWLAPLQRRMHWLDAPSPETP